MSDICLNQSVDNLSSIYEECYYLCFGLNKAQLDWKKARELLENVLEEELNEIQATIKADGKKQDPLPKSSDVKGKMLLLLAFLCWQTNTSPLIPALLKASSDPRATFYLGRYYSETHKPSEASTCYHKAAADLLPMVSDSLPSPSSPKIVPKSKSGSSLLGSFFRSTEDSTTSASSSPKLSYSPNLTTPITSNVHNTDNKCQILPIDIDWTYYMIGFLSQVGQGLELDYLSAAYWYQIATNHGHVIAQYNLGLLYQDGLGVIKDGEEAFRLFKLASDQNYCHAQLHLGGFYEGGKFTDQDLTKAINLYQKAAAHGLTVAQVTLGHRYKEGVGCEKDLAKAAEWFQVAADKGSCRGQTALALCYEHGHGVTKDRDKALALYKLAAREREPIFLFNLAVCYKVGFGVPADRRKAAELYTLSIEEVRPGAREKLPFAKHNLATIYQEIDPDMAEVVCTQYNIDEMTMFNLVDEKTEGEGAQADSADDFAKALKLFLPLLESRTRTGSSLPFISLSLVNGCRNYYWYTYVRYFYLGYLIPPFPTLTSSSSSVASPIRKSSTPPNPTPPPSFFSRLSALPRRFSFPLFLSKKKNTFCFFTRLPRILIEYIVNFLTVKIKYQETPGLW